MKFILTIDTEGDNQWNHGIPLSTENLRYIPRFQKLCDCYQIKPTYLVTSEVCKDKFAINIFKNILEKRTAEIGAHLHSWTTPPFEDKDGLRFNDSYHAFASELAESLLDQKILNLTQEIETAFSVHPTSFRSGRFGFNDTCAKLLIKNNYLVDSSITPYVNWSMKRTILSDNGGPNFSRFSNNHHFIYTEEGRILEIPVTILPTKWPLTVNESLSSMYFSWKESLLKKIVRKLFIGRQPLWLRPYTWTNLKLLEKIVDRSNDLSLKFITMMFHSSELMPGCSPYRKNELEVENLYLLLNSFFEFLSECGIDSITLSDSIKHLRE
jgi:hypothetical protein